MKSELQIRTVLMHAWAEIEHKLSYKKTAHVPKNIRRKFFRISAILEDADEQFQDISDEIKKSKNKMLAGIKKYEMSGQEMNFDLDALKIILEYYFPEKVKDKKIIWDFFDEIAKSKITVEDLIKLYKSKIKE